MGRTTVQSIRQIVAHPLDKDCLQEKEKFLVLFRFLGWETCCSFLYPIFTFFQFLEKAGPDQVPWFQVYV